jgi:ATP-dependent Zn protease
LAAFRLTEKEQNNEKTIEIRSIRNKNWQKRHKQDQTQDQTVSETKKGGETPAQAAQNNQNDKKGAEAGSEPNAAPKNAISAAALTPKRAEGLRREAKARAIVERDGTIAFGGGRYWASGLARRARAGSRMLGSTLLAQQLTLSIFEERLIESRIGGEAVLRKKGQADHWDDELGRGFAELALFFPKERARAWAKTEWKEAVALLDEPGKKTEELKEEADEIASMWEAGEEGRMLGANRLTEAEGGRARAWALWATQVASLEALQEIIEHSKQTLALIAADAELSEPCAQLANASALGRRLGLSEESSTLWGQWLAWCEMGGNGCSEAMRCVAESLHWEGEPQRELWEAFERAVGAPRGALAELFAPESILDRAGLTVGRRGSDQFDWSRHSGLRMASAFIGLSGRLFKPATGEAELIGRFVRPAQTHGAGAANEGKGSAEGGFATSTASGAQERAAGEQGEPAESAEAELGWRVADFTWAEREAKAVLAALQSGEPVKILLWGLPGVGKTELALALAREAGLRLAVPPALSAWEMTNKERDQGAIRLQSVVAADKLSGTLGRVALLVDEAETILKGAKGSDRKSQIVEAFAESSTPQIWVVNDLAETHAATLRRFSFVAKIEPMPLRERERLAAKIFEDKELALRAAQALRTPAELAQARDWCRATGQWSWESISLLLSGRQKANGAAQEHESGDQEFTSLQVIVPDGAPSAEQGFAAIAGYPEVKSDGRELIEFFREPERYRKMGAKIPRGVLLTGAPGVGKTLFARALAQEAMAPIVLAASSELAARPSRIGEVFAEARRRAPCVVFLDEIDILIGDTRDGAGKPQVERQKILNRLLLEMDGFDPLEGVLVLGATHSTDRLDDAAARSGRFGRTIEFREPSFEDREAILRHAARDVPTAKGVDWAALAESSQGFSGADLAQAVNTAAMAAARARESAVGEDYLFEALDQVAWGDATGVPMTEEARQRVCVHESGHAMLALAAGLRVDRMTVRARRGMLGAVMSSQAEGDHVFGEAQAMGRLRVCMAGMAAEETVYGHADAGSGGDLETATKLAHRFVTRWGLSDMKLGGLALAEPFAAVSDGLVGRWETERERLLSRAHAEAGKLLSERRKMLLGLAAWIREKREANGLEIREWLAAWGKEHPDEAPLEPAAERVAARANLLPLTGVQTPAIALTRAGAARRREQALRDGRADLAGAAATAAWGAQGAAGAAEREGAREPQLLADERKNGAEIPALAARFGVEAQAQSPASPETQSVPLAAIVGEAVEDGARLMEQEAGKAAEEDGQGAEAGADGGAETAADAAQNAGGHLTVARRVPRRRGKSATPPAAAD